MSSEHLCRNRLLSHTASVKPLLHAVAATTLGLEKVLAKELSVLGYAEASRQPGRITIAFPHDRLTETLARLNMGTRTADRVFLELGSFRTQDFDGFYAGVAGLPWDLVCVRDSRVVVERVRAVQCRLSAQTTLQAMAQKAIYASLMKMYGMQRMPETGDEVRVRLWGDHDEWQVVVDTSGDALSKRGYRRLTHAAPLKETLAAGMLFLAGWSRSRPLCDPFCGSGTIPIEAALYARDAAPGLHRRFAFERWPIINGKALHDVRQAFEERLRDDISADIQARDIDARALDLARANARLAGVDALVHFDRAQAEDAKPWGNRGVLLANPPYGQRLGDAAAAQSLYRALAPMLGRFLDAGWECGFITSDPDFGRYAGTRPTSVRTLISGQETLYFSWFSGHKPADSKTRHDS